MSQEGIAVLLFLVAVATFVVWLARLERRPFGPRMFLVNKFAGTIRLSAGQWLSESEPCLASFAIMALLPSAQFVQSEQEADTFLSVVDLLDLDDGTPLVRHLLGSVELVRVD